MALAAHGLAVTTSTQYDRLFGHFVDYCAGEGIEALPATTETVIAYVGHMAELLWGLGTCGQRRPCSPSSPRLMMPIVATVRLPPPALDDHLLSRTRQGLRRAQAEVETRDSRTPLPAEAAVLEDGEATPVLQHQQSRRLSHCAGRDLRRQAGLSSPPALVGHQHLGHRDLVEIWLRLSEKGKKGQAIRRIVRLPLSQSPLTSGWPPFRPSVCGIAALLRHYFDARTEALHGAPEPEFAFQLPGEVRPTTASMELERWLDRALSRYAADAADAARRS